MNEVRLRPFARLTAATHHAVMGKDRTGTCHRHLCIPLRGELKFCGSGFGETFTLRLASLVTDLVVWGGDLLRDIGLSSSRCRKEGRVHARVNTLSAGVTAALGLHGNFEDLCICRVTEFCS